ncbi:DUF6754 domain-containing protein [Chloroflexota bacterium]
MEDLVLLLFLLILPCLFFLTFRVRAGKTGALRHMPGMEELQVAVQRSAETGRALHLSVGVAGVGGTSTPETWAGLTVLSQLAGEAAIADVPLLVTVADPTVLPIAQDMVRRAYARSGNPKGYDSTQIRLIAPNPAAYAAGVMGVLEREPLARNIMIGAFGDEYLLMGETGFHRDIHQVVGTADPRTLPFAYATADETLEGEEMFAGGAYTSRLPMQVGSLLAEDWGRWLIAGAIIIIAVLRLLN